MWPVLLLLGACVATLSFVIGFAAGAVWDEWVEESQKANAQVNSEEG